MLWKTILVLCLATMTINSQAQQSQSITAASTACADLDQGDLCAFVNDQGANINGSCQADDKGKLTCVATD